MTVPAMRLLIVAATVDRSPWMRGIENSVPKSSSWRPLAVSRFMPLAT